MSKNIFNKKINWWNKENWKPDRAYDFKIFKIIKFNEVRYCIYKKIKRRKPKLREIEFSKLIEVKRLIKIKNQNKISKNKILSLIILFIENLILLIKKIINIIVNKFVNNDENNKKMGKKEIIRTEKKWFKLFFFNWINSFNIVIKLFF